MINFCADGQAYWIYGDNGRREMLEVHTRDVHSVRGRIIGDPNDLVIDFNRVPMVIECSAGQLTICQIEGPIGHSTVREWRRRYAAVQAA